MDSETLKILEQFIRSLPGDISYVIASDSEDMTKTIGREYALSLIEDAKT